MKKLFLVIIAFVAIVFSENSTAQNQKFGHINASELLELMPERAKITTDLQAYQKQLETQINTMYTEYQSKRAEFETNEQVWTDIVKEAKIQEISDFEVRIQKFEQNAQQDLANKQQELAKPLLEKAQQAIKDVSKANGYTYVFDTSVGVLLSYPEGDDLLPLVKKHLGIL